MLSGGARRTLALPAFLGFGLVWMIFFRPVLLGGDVAYIKVAGSSMEPTFQGGDLVVVHAQESYQRGDVIAYRADGGIVIHRIVGGNGQAGFDTQGDNQPYPDAWRPTNDQIVGSQIVHVPSAGVITDILQNPTVLACAAFAAVAFVVGTGAQRAHRRRRS